MDEGQPLAILAVEQIRHDLKNQLAVIRGFAAILLADAAPTDPRLSDFEEVHKAAQTALDLLERLAPALPIAQP